MHLITPFKSLLQGGMTLSLRITSVGGQNIQLDILPRGKDSATGVALPPKALVGTAEEIDTHLEAYLYKYAASVARVADVVANADAELRTLEDAAAAQARKAVEEKAKPAAISSKHAPAKASRGRDLRAGLLDEEEHADGDDERHGGNDLTGPSGAAASPAPVVEAVSPDLFKV